MKFTLETIRAIEKRAQAENWPYHYLFNSLKAAGIERYETNVLTHEITYVGGGGSLPVPAPVDFTPLTAGTAFDLDGLKKAIARSQKRETTYPQFLAEIAAAGVTFYRVDMLPRTVTYHGVNKGKHVEKVPES